MGWMNHVIARINLDHLADAWDYDARDAHWNMHSMEMEPRNEDRVLDCEICCGLPPWEWKDYRANVNVAGLMGVRMRLGWGEPNPYGIEYTAFNWRKPRNYMFSDVPWFKCRECGQWRESDNWRPAPYIEYEHYEYFKANSICSACAEAEKKAFLELPQETQYNEIQSLISKLWRKHGKD